MIISTALSAIPFLGLTDSVRLQMSGKYLSQTVTHLNCERPYVIGNNWKYLTGTSTLSRYSAPFDGQVVYSNDEIMIVVFDNNTIETLKTPKYLEISYNFTAQLRYKRELGDFKKDDLIYEYDNFIDEVPSYGYNTNVAYMPFFGFNFEDAIIISESFAKKAKTLKSQTITIPIYTYTLFKNNYLNSKLEFIPDIGQLIENRIVCNQVLPKNTINIKKQVLSAMSIYDIMDIKNDNLQFNSVPIISKIEFAKVSKIKIHKLSNNLKLLDTNLQKTLESLLTDYRVYNNKIYNEMSAIVGADYAKRVLSSNYIMTNSPFNTEELVYVIELQLIKEVESKIGDKLSNRYANKGVISLIIPDELRPIDLSNGEPIDMISTPLGIFNRMNLGQLLDGIIGKCIKHCEKNLTVNNIEDTLQFLSELASKTDNEEYSKEILNIKNNKSLHNLFLEDVKKNGLYFEIPNFPSFNVVDIIEFIESRLNILPNNDVLLSKELVDLMFTKLEGLDTKLKPTEDVVLKDVFSVPIYIMKLKQLATGKLNARDFGEYSSNSKMPSKSKDDTIGKSSRIGSMEVDGLIAHSAIKTLKEIRSVKSTSINLKKDLINQIITNGGYTLPNDNSKSFVKVMIDSLITFMNEN
jgi:DNA-directed RNA polymerase beta subunit